MRTLSFFHTLFYGGFCTSLLPRKERTEIVIEIVKLEYGKLKVNSRSLKYLIFNNSNSIAFLLGCSGGYNMATYPDYKHINSQINEQMKSCLKRIKPSLSYMRHDHFVDHTKLFLACRNIMTKERRQRSQNAQADQQ